MNALKVILHILTDCFIMAWYQNTLNINIIMFTRRDAWSEHGSRCKAMMFRRTNEGKDDKKPTTVCLSFRYKTLHKCPAELEILDI